MLPDAPIEEPTLETVERHAISRRRGWRDRLGEWAAGEGVNEEVETVMKFPMCAAEAWERIAFFEEALGRPPWILRRVIPEPVGVEGDKRHVGGLVRCAYQGGEIVKLMTVLERPEYIAFEVMGQDLGIETMLLVRGGSYRLEEDGKTCRVRLTTRYTSFLHPRWFCRYVEKWLMGMLHWHILKSMRGWSRA